MEIVVLLAAELDIQTAFNRFEEYREGLGVTFLQELEVAYEYLQRHPRIGRLYAEDRRRFLVPNFPFGIFYSIIADRIVISAVLDLRQDPERVRKRLEE
jgi:plasmid stabilization system protein ParE